MKLLILSDTHLQNDLLKNITDKYPGMDYYIHCGDSSLKNDDPLLKKYLTVNGNHDRPGTFKTNIIFNAGKYRCLITHGNKFNIYYGNEQLLAFMKKSISILHFMDILMCLLILLLKISILLILAV